MLKKKMLAVAVGLAAGGLSMASFAGAAGPGYLAIDMDRAQTGDNEPNMYAQELLDQQLPGPVVIKDNFHGGTRLAVKGVLNFGTNSDEDALYLRFDLINARFNNDMDANILGRSNISVSNARNLQVVQSGTQGSDFVIISARGPDTRFNISSRDWVHPESHGGLEIDDEFVMDFDTGHCSPFAVQQETCDPHPGTPGAGLTVLDPALPVSVELCMYDDLGDASNALPEDALGACRTSILAVGKEGLSLQVTPKPNPVADVYAYDGPYMDFVRSKYGHGCYGQQKGKCDGGQHRVHDQNFGSVEIITQWTDPLDGLPSVPQDYMNLTRDSNGAYIFIDGGSFNWADNNDMYLRNGDYCGKTWDNDADLGKYVPPFPVGPFNEDGPISGWVADMNPEGDPPDINGGPDTGLGRWSVCIDDRRGDHEPIPIVNAFDATLVMPGRQANENDPEGDTLAGISRNGTVFRQPFITTAPAALQRVIFDNRGPLRAEYSTVCTAEEGYSVHYGSQDGSTNRSTGYIEAGTTLKVDLDDIVHFRDAAGDVAERAKGGCVWTVAGRVADIDAAVTLMVNGAIDSTNMTHDEGHIKGEEPDTIDKVPETGGND